MIISVRLNIYNNLYYIKLTSNGIVYEHLQKLNYVNWYLDYTISKNIMNNIISFRAI